MTRTVCDPANPPGAFLALRATSPSSWTATGRWAKKRLLPRAVGHKRGVDAVREVVRAARHMGLEALTLYAFSSENWKRPEDEISDLMGLLRAFIRSDVDEFAANDVRLKDYRQLPASCQPISSRLIDDALARTAAQPPQPTLAIALNYGSQQEIARAAAAAAAKGEVTVARIEAELDTADLPPLDLV